MIALPSPPAAALLLTGTWLCLALLMPRLARRWHIRARWTLVALGVPTVGLLTLLWGPGIGVAGFALGLLALLGRQSPRRAVPVMSPVTGPQGDGPT
ncbi:DUF2484 family protein [Paracoccus beibuensis]|uniref:DUF2484 family protein n=1 Tax=Paracoccus beibuensis TaxID=547602 RepID=UPI00223FD220|nr:DUF2484 family protein [Paracoccus beibuensis]